MTTGPRTTRRWRSLAAYAVMALFALAYALPILMMAVGSFKPDAKVLTEAGTIKGIFPDDVTLENYSDVFARVNFLRYLLNSLLITGAIVLGGLLVNSMAGYAFARMRWHGRDVVFAAVLSLMILPFEAIAVPLFYQVTILGWRDTYIAQILPFIANAFSIYLFYSFFLDMPRELEESAWMDGAGPYRTFFQIIAPNAKPVFATVTIVTFLFYWGFYLWPLMITSGEAVRPLPVAIAEFHVLPPRQWGDILAFGVMMVAPVLLVFLIFQRWFVQGIARSGVKG
ncbi:carbohydrate ABC transporter permease [bacterium]|nr:carbohydrate ABC transporter permease [bacterium]